MMNVSSSTREIIKLMTTMLSGVSVFISFILGFLIIYASRFLIKRRNKEFGIYLTLGMSKRKISLILFIETILIGIISLIIGLFLGTILSQFMSVLVANMFEADMTKFEFVFSKSACIKTLIYFGIMYLLVMIFNTINISKCKLIDLLYLNKKSEKIKLKNPIICIIIFIISTLILSYAYYLVTGGINSINTANKIFTPIILGVISTFLIFWSLSGLILRIFMSMKKLYYKDLNSFTLRQVSSKINTTVFSMTIICLMLFVTICVLSSSLAIKNSMSSNINELAPVDIELVKEMNLDDSYLERGYSKELIKNSKLSIIEMYENLGFDLNMYLKDIITFPIYETSDLTLSDTLGNQSDKIKEQFRFMQYDTKEMIIKLSDYNKVATLYNNETYSLNNDEYMIIADFDSMITIRNESLNNNTQINLFGHTLKPKYKECKNGFIDISSNHINGGIIIVPDEVVDDKFIVYDTLIANYKANSKKEKYEIENILKSTYSLSEDYIFPTKISKIEITEASIGLGALVTFIGLYLGIVFLISSAAILALKELSEAADNKERYNVLRRLGADEKMINKALFRQIGIFFMTPLLLSIIHSIFGIQFCSYIIETFGNEKLLTSIIMTAIFLIIIYGGYFLITYICSKNIIKEKN